MATELPWFSSVRSVWANGNQSFVERADGKIYPWGQNRLGTLGIEADDDVSASESLIFELDQITNLGNGVLHTIGLRQDDAVCAWGWSFEGSLDGGDSNDIRLATELIEKRNGLPPGGVATVELDVEQPFLQFLPELNLSQLATVSQGRKLFVAEWSMTPDTRPLLDGLGPLAVASACAGCHLHVGRAPSLNDDGAIGVGLFFRLGCIAGEADPHLGRQLQTFSTVDLPEAEVHWQNSDQNQPQFFSVALLIRLRKV